MMDFNYGEGEGMDHGYGARRHATWWQKAKPYAIGFGIGLTLATCGKGCSSHAAEYRQAAVISRDVGDTSRPSLELLVR